MNCSRCKTGFCWSCMGTDEDHDKRCGGCPIPLCPRLPHAMCINLLITFAAILLCPLVFALGPIIAALGYGLIFAPIQMYDAWKYGCCRNTRCLGALLAILTGWLLVLPICLTLAIIFASLACTIGTVVFWFCSFSYLIILTKNTLK